MAFTKGNDMVGVQHIEVAGKRLVILEESEYERLCGRAGETIPLTDDDLPPLPKPNKDGRFPAEEYTRVALARDMIRERKAAGLIQQELADLAGTRQETISRIESGSYKASAKTIEKIDRALKKALRSKHKGR